MTDPRLDADPPRPIADDPGAAGALSGPAGTPPAETATATLVPSPSEGDEQTRSSDPLFDIIESHPGRAVPWPPGPNQRGLSAPYPPGGTDPHPDAGQREDRYYLRLLVAMVLLIVVGGFAVSILGFVLGFVGGAD